MMGKNLIEQIKISFTFNENRPGGGIEIFQAGDQASAEGFMKC